MNVEQGPLLEAGDLSAGLDYYKPTMSQLAFEQEPDAEVTFTFKNRGEQRLADYLDVENLQQRFDDIRRAGWKEHELGYLAGIHNSAGERVFTDNYLDFLRTHELPEVDVKLDEDTDDIAIETTGPWALSSFWETIVMSELNEAYFENYVTAQGLDLEKVYEEGQRRLDEKIAILNANPDIKLADFGTRRHFSLRWQKHVVEELATRTNNLVGTSNVALARTLGLKPIGTFAHEMPMVYAALADARGEDIRASHQHFLHDWEERYGEDLSTILPDTFGTKFFFADFTKEQAEKSRGLRHDSGDPFEFGKNAIDMYKNFAIDPHTKTLVFSNGLDMPQTVAIQKEFRSRVGTLYGIGTSSTCDFGIVVRPLNVVMKATRVRIDGKEAETVKISDDEGKHTGSPEKLAEYEIAFGARPAGRLALARALETKLF